MAVCVKRNQTAACRILRQKVGQYNKGASGSPFSQRGTVGHHSVIGAQWVTVQSLGHSGSRSVTGAQWVTVQSLGLSGSSFSHWGTVGHHSVTGA